MPLKKAENPQESYKMDEDRKIALVLASLWVALCLWRFTGEYLDHPRIQCINRQLHDVK